MPESSMEKIPLKALSRKQRRVLGVLLEKAFTTPEQYPLTPKATVAGCNQKSNRDPVTGYDEDDVEQTLNELREMGFVGEVHTEGGRTSRYRHYVRHRTTLTEMQMAIMTELMLRGRQQMGELRTRASRMVPIDSQETLRAELQPLIEQGLARANGSLERRGVEVDHNLYAPGENREALSEYREDDDAPVATESRPIARQAATFAPARETPAAAPVSSGGLDALRAELSELRQELADLREEVRDLQRQLGG